MIYAVQAFAQPVMDGRLSGDESLYGSALSIQNTRGRYGEANVGDPINGGNTGGGGGSEIDQIFAVVSGGRLNVFIAGNLQHNFNKMEVFIDSIAGGSNTINGAALPTGVDGFCCGGLNATDGALQRMNGLTFDTGFNADYYLTFTHGFETVNPNTPQSATFWAMSAHFADLTTDDGDAMANVRAGMQLAHNGQPNVLRSPGDYNKNGRVDGRDFLTWQRQFGSATTPSTGPDANGDLTVDGADFAIWQARYGRDTSLAGSPFTPATLANGVSDALLAAALPGLSQGQLIDSNYALGAGGCTDNSGAGCVARELAFALPVDQLNDPDNTFSHRDFENSVDLQLGFDNRNKEGVSVTANEGPFDLDSGTADDNPETVTTGLEFSIPLAQIGNPAGGIKLTVFIGNGAHTDISNQVSGVGMLGPKIGPLFYGSPPPATFNDIPGDQFITVTQPAPFGSQLAVVPEPASIVLIVAMLVAAAGSRQDYV
jgi:hypothetical protein